MKNWKLESKIADVAKYVECYWFLEKELHDKSFSYPKLNPDPASHLIISSSQNHYNYSHGNNTQHVHGSHWVFPHRKTFVMDHSAPFQMLGVKFKVGALYALRSHDFNYTLGEIEAVDFNRFFGLSNFNPHPLLMMAAEEKQQVCAMLDEALLPGLSECHEDKHSLLVNKVMLLLENTAIAEIGGNLHRSQRTIERSFAKVTGFSMKQVQSMVHLEKILNYLYPLNKEEINWVSVANQFNFSDQPHLIRHFKNTIGKTPAHYTQD